METTSPLSKNEELLFQLLEALPTGVFILDPKGKPVYANHMAQQLLGKGIVQGGGPDQLAETYQAFLAGTLDPYPASRMPVVRALSGESSMIADMEIHQPDRVIPLQVWGAPIVDAEGKMLYAIAAFSDISDRKQVEQRLMTQYTVARALAESATLRDAAPRILRAISEEVNWDFGAIWVTNPARDHLKCVGLWHRRERELAEFGEATANSAFGPGIGLPGKVWETREPVWIGDVVPATNFPRSPVAARCGLHGGVGFPVIIAGEVHAVIEFFSREIRKPDEAFRRMMVAYADQIAQIIQRERAEEGMKKAKEAAEQAARSKSEFLAIMSHEIRTPMNAVMGMTSLLLETALTAEQQEYAETIRRSNESLLTVINDILDFSKIESTQLVLEEHPLVLNSTIEQVFDLFARQAFEKRIELLYSIDKGVPPWIQGDVTRLRQILVNLINNALKFTEKGEIVIFVSKVAEDNGQLDLRFSVRDTGIGIPADRIDRLFRPFSQADTSSTRRYGGTGLGLAICARLVELMGGRIAVDSEVGKGSTFTFNIRTSPAAIPANVQPRETVPEIMNKVILLVDDNSTSLEILKDLCRQWGLITHATNSAREALDWLRAGARCDLAIIDMVMEGMDGVELGKEIGRLRSGHQLPTILLTALGEKAAVDGSVSAFIPKPIRRSQLFDAITNILSAGEVATPLPLIARKLDPMLADRLPLKILVVEDNPTNQLLMIRVLQKMGYIADTAGNGLEALEALKRQSYDVVFMDVEMPEMNGIETTKTIVNTWPEQNRPFIVGTTAYSTESDARECLDAGMDTCLSKPIKVEELQRILQERGKYSPGRTAEKSSPNVAGPIVDLERVKEVTRMGGQQQPELLLHMIDLFLKDFPDNLRTMKELVVRGDLSSLRKTAHRLKGSSLNLGVRLVASTCKEVENRARENDLEGARALVLELERSSELVRTELLKARTDAMKGTA
jgi:signal transduction histidine kinase/CheY-like chemotaxis protein/HPt (histidine-containing phosphotransfer) domain-containing protein